jgi:hypothetical protein
MKSELTKPKPVDIADIKYNLISECHLQELKIFKEERIIILN